MQEKQKGSIPHLSQLKELQSLHTVLFVHAVILFFFQMFAEREGHSATTLKVNMNASKYNNCRIAKDGETPNVNLSIGLGSPASPELYEGVL